MGSGGSGWAFTTMTHARLRADQGDVAGATHLLQAILAVEPNHREALALAARLGAQPGIRHAEPEDPELAAPRPARARDLAASFRASFGRPKTSSSARKALRLRAWLDGVALRRGERGVR